MRQLTFGVCSFVALLLALSQPAWAASEISLKQSDGTSTPLGGTGSSANVNIMSSEGKVLGGCTPTVAAPTNAEGVPAPQSCLLDGPLRVSVEYIKVLLACEDQTNNLCKTGGADVRLTTFGSVTSATTSTTTTVPLGVKTFMAYMGGASETKAFDLTIYGNWQNSTTGGQPVCQLWVPSTASVTHIETSCKDIVKNYAYWYYTADTYTSASAASLIVYAQY